MSDCSRRAWNAPKWEGVEFRQLGRVEMDKEQMQGEPTQDLSTMLENTRKSRDEFKNQVATLKSTVDVQAGYIEKQST